MPMNMRCQILKPRDQEIEKVSNIDPVVIESVNHISGAHAALFWDILYGTSESIIALENTEAVLTFLYGGDNFGEALMLIRAYYELLGMDWPDEFVIIERIGEQHIKPALGNIPIGEITAEKIQKLLNEKQKVGSRKDGRDGALSTSSVIKMKVVINASLKQAVKNRLIPFNPTEAVTPPKMTRREIRVLTPEEQDKFMNVLKGHRLEAFFKIALSTGMRKGELLALTWDKVDFEKNTISISKTASRIRNHETRKT